MHDPADAPCGVVVHDRRMALHSKCVLRQRRRRRTPHHRAAGARGGRPPVRSRYHMCTPRGNALASALAGGLTAVTKRQQSRGRPAAVSAMHGQAARCAAAGVTLRWWEKIATGRRRVSSGGRGLEQGRGVLGRRAGGRRPRALQGPEFPEVGHIVGQCASSGRIRQVG